MYKKHLTPMIVTLLLVLTPTVAFGAHYLLGYSSVDSGEIRWTSSTSYTSARDWANTKWNGLGQINIAPDTWYTARDLDWRDTNDSSVNWVGLYSNYSWSYDTITLNDHHMGSNGDCHKNTTTHELGHALGLDHSFYGQIMAISLNCSLHTLQTQDIDDYNYLYP